MPVLLPNQQRQSTACNEQDKWSKGKNWNKGRKQEHDRNAKTHTFRIGTGLRPVTDGKSLAESLQAQSPPSLQTYQTEQSDRLSSCAVDTDVVSISHETTQSLALVVSVCLCSPNISEGIVMPREKVVFQYRFDEVCCYLKIRSDKWNEHCLKKHP